MAVVNKEVCQSKTNMLENNNEALLCIFSTLKKRFESEKQLSESEVLEKVLNKTVGRESS